MATKRRKAPKKDLPKTTEEAVLLAERFLALDAQIADIKAQADAAIIQIQTARDALKLPVEQDLKKIFADLRDWWAVSGAQLLDKNRKSKEIGGILIGERTTPPALKHPGIKAEDIAQDMLALGLTECLRITITVDKPATLRALKPDDDLSCLLTWLGLVTEQKDEFFIDRAAPAEADPEIMVTEGEAA